ncbi:Na+/H+ antiporter NhaC family protein [Georgenia sp. EYE_87]|uniref:Na+/H+ antiporter NhaC family protein n=1 Tax=Georgenia sp. EYE_87 TaxID=2853448 RepID=UPI002005BD25|nr:Na+/H+ antiporter NhaC family protein [Georgenia sp. EYE_87]MCK6211244.1 Na+/H+ antiporter NhaC family protein [Georgenia sp. EYE_87]
MTEAPTFLSVVPPLLAILMVVLTRKVLLSLGTGVVSAALVVAGGNPLDAGRLVWEAFVGIFWADGAVNTWNIYILLFLLILGVVAAFIMMAGGSRAFGRWAMERVGSRRGSQLLAAVLGVVIFIDDYFNALAVGQVAKPLTDRHRVSRAKLSYIIDSTSAPVCVIAPFSSWGASIIGIMAPIVAAAGLVEVTAFEAFLGTIPLNYYAWATLALVFASVLLRIDLGAMRKEELRTLRDGRPYAPGRKVAGELAKELPEHRPGSIGALVLPFLALVVGVVGAIVWTGHTESGSWNLMEIFASTLVTESLIVGGALGLAVTLVLYLKDTRSNERFGFGTFRDGWTQGMSSMLPAIYILVLAWMLVGLIDQLGTGQYLAGLVATTSLDPQFLVPIMFVVAAAMAFATGTSWGSFGILLPIAGQVMSGVDEPGLVVPAMAAVLAGAVFGDHCSPISDTTILSSTGAGANHIDHVMTQLPYALTAAGASLAGYVVLALTSSTWAGLAVTALVLAGVLVRVRRTVRPVEEEAAAFEAAAV